MFDSRRASGLSIFSFKHSSWTHVFLFLVCQGVLASGQVVINSVSYEWIGANQKTEQLVQPPISVQPGFYIPQRPPVVTIDGGRWGRSSFTDCIEVPLYTTNEQFVCDVTPKVKVGHETQYKKDKLVMLTNADGQLAECDFWQKGKPKDCAVEYDWYTPTASTSSIVTTELLTKIAQDLTAGPAAAG